MSLVNFRKERYSMDWSASDEHQPFFYVMTKTIPWKVNPILLCNSTDSRKYLTVEIECLHENIPDNDWHIDAEIQLRFSTKEGEFGRKFVNRFNSRPVPLNCGLLLITQDFKGYTLMDVHREIDIEVFIRIKKEEGIQLSEFSIPRNINTEIAFRIEHHRLYVDKYILMAVSPILRKMFLEDEDLDEIVVKPYEHYGKKDMKCSHKICPYIHCDIFEFVAFLRMLYGYQQDLSKAEIFEILDLATRYEIESVISNCEDFLISSNHMAKGEKLWISEKYGLSKLQDEVMDQITVDEIETIVKRESKYTRRKTVKALFTKLIEIYDELDNE